MIKKTKKPGFDPKNLGKQKQAVLAGVAVLLQNSLIRQVLVGFFQQGFHQVNKWIEPLQYFYNLEQQDIKGMKLPDMGKLMADGVTQDRRTVVWSGDTQVKLAV